MNASQFNECYSEILVWQGTFPLGSVMCRVSSFRARVRVRDAAGQTRNIIRQFEEQQLAAGKLLSWRQPLPGPIIGACESGAAMIRAKMQDVDVRDLEPQNCERRWIRLS
jgi:hypothetical protein